MSNYRPTIILVFIFSFLNSSAQSIIVKPYLQNATSNSITIMWESSNCNPGIIEWGTSNSLGSIVAASLLNSQGSACIFTGNVIGLQPETKYFYRVATGNVFSPLYSFITPSLRERTLELAKAQKKAKHICNNIYINMSK